jgi:nitroimidazol reductase NimA-like FMN-containing flavoprotein (pyridoxamine 5'-phosphate oxidase superfamily)
MFVREMTVTECLTTLAPARLARLACARENQPYVVPLYLLYHDPFLYGLTTPGQKVEWMRANPRVCVEFDDIQSFDHWTSDIIIGRYEELPDSFEWGQERLRAYELLQEYVDWWEPGAAARGPHGSTHPSQAIYYRIHIDHITGRRAAAEVE